MQSKHLNRLSVILASLLFVVAVGPASAQGGAADTRAPVAVSSDDAVYQYNLGAGDKVRIKVYGEEDLGGEFTVSGEGKLSLPLIGEVQAVGRTVAQVQEAIQDAYKQGYLRDPRVNIEVLNFRPFYILGEVSKPGEYPYNNGMTVVNAVALAQGFTYRADQKWVYVKHANGIKEEKIPLSSVATVSPGDTIRIAERYF